MTVSSCLPRLSRLSGFATRTDGSLSAAAAILLPAMLMVAGIGIDISDLNAQRKLVQGQADLAALSAVRNLSSVSHARTAATHTLLQTEAYEMAPPGAGDIRFGRVEAGVFVANADQSRLEGVTAVKVIGRSPARFPVLGRFFLREAPPLVTRAAVATVDPRVSFALSNCLLSLNLLNGMLAQLTAETDLLCSGHGLRINAVSLFRRLALQGELLTPATTYGDVLDAQLPLIDILEAAYATAGLPARLATPAFAFGPMRLGELVTVGEGIRELQVTNSLLPPLDLSLADLVFGSLEVLGERIVDLEAELALGRVAGAAVGVRISEPRVIVLGARPGDPNAQARSAQIRIAVEDLKLSPLLRLSLGLDIANSRAALSAEGAPCSRHAADTAALFDPVTAELLNVDIALELLGLPLGRLLEPVKSLKLMESRVTRLSFTHDDVARGVQKEVHADDYQIDVQAPAQITQAVARLVGAFHHEVETSGAGGSCKGPGCALSSGLGAGLDVVLGTVGTALSTTRANLANPQSAEGGVLQTLLEDVLGFAFVETQLQVLGATCRHKLAL